MSHIRIAFLLTVVFTVALGTVAATSGPSFWTVATAADFLRGTSDGVFVNLNGVVSSGPQLTNRLTTTPAQIWSLVEAADGTMWAGTGGDGRVIRLRPGQPEETVFDAAENNVFAIALSGTRVYAATSPDGKVYVIDGAAPARVFFDPAEKYIWALAVDATGRLWVGTGNPAVIYRVMPDGTSAVVYRPPAAHVVALTRDSSGRVLAGTESPGRLYRFDAPDKPFVLLDSGLSEMRSIIAGANGVIFAAAVSRGDEGSSAGDPASVAAVAAAAASSTSGTAAATTAPTASTATSTPSSRRSVLYRIEPNGAWEDVWTTSDVIYDVAAQNQDAVLVATGGDGRLYRVDRDRQVSMFTGVDARQITRFSTSARAGAPVTFATANPGRIVAIGSGEQSPATYVSPVRDTKGVSSWGLIRWESAGTVTMFTRSGNTEKPDDSWSDWSAAYTKRDGEAIASPAARFLQWKAVLTKPSAGATPATNAPTQLTAVTVAYLGRNNRPTLPSITVHPPGVVFQRPFASEDGAIAGLDDAVADARRPPGDTGPTPPAPGRRMFQKGLQTITWKGDDEDGDHLSYTLQYRREGETAWRDLRAGLSDAIFVWDTTSVADGRYVLRIVVSDAPSNAADRALTGDRETDPVEVDNTPPTATTEIARNGSAVRLVVRVHDARSPIQKLEYSLAGGAWLVVYPVDGLADSPDERYEIPLASEADAARIVIRATDLLQNVLSQSVR